MKLWIDDVRTPPDDTWIWAKTAFEAIGYIIKIKVSKISFDHDLGTLVEGESRINDMNTGYEVACYIETLSRLDIVERIEWDVHSANPVGRKRIEQAMTSAERYWKK